MKSIKFLTPIFLFLCFGCFAQDPGSTPQIGNVDFDKKISSLISFTVPVMGVDELKEMKEDVILLDARKKEEFEISHIEGAKYIGFKKFDASNLEGIDKDEQIVVYCSIGYRSEKIGEKLKNLGYKNVYNLYGSIFEWVNDGNEIVDKNNKPTKEIHTYNKKWSKWVEEGKANKVW